jgi:hypothetical protein
MRFFKNIWVTLTRLIKKKAPSTEKIIIEEQEILSNPIDTEIIYGQIEENLDENGKEDLYAIIAKQKVAKEILENVVTDANKSLTNIRGSKPFYELHELRNELQNLYVKKAKLEFLESRIHQISYPDSTSFDLRIANLSKIQNKNKNKEKIKISTVTISTYQEDLYKLEKILSNKSTLKSHYKREAEVKKKRQIYENNIKKEFQNLDLLLIQNNFDDAKILINRLSKAIKPDYRKGTERLLKAIDKLKEKELEVFKKRQAELFREQQKEAEKIKLEENKLQELLKKEKEQEEELKKLHELKKIEKEGKLKALLNRKSNWRDYRKILQDNNINILYHFTDQSNLKSIKDNGGLFSWHYCDRNNIVIPMTGNSALGRSLDLQFGLEDYVRLSFIKDHPMKYVAIDEGRITKPYLLNVSTEVCYFENTKFSDMNAADKRHKNEDSANFLSTLKFNLFEKKYFDLNAIEKKQYQAEVLIKTWIPAEYITNLNDIS